ncbi:MAG: glutamate--tRNA ligase [Candidatus Nealsonbacteria bacterium]|nr:glutamate--tRNA ligase [Candidatus Nealsonbacteria bacterium]
MIPEDFQLVKPGEIRVRFAPSPTGYFHIGTARGALFNYLFAQKNQGSFVLRIEDTDKERSSPEFEKDIIEGLKWLGLDWSEGPDVGGAYGPYRQSERTDTYSDYLEKLLVQDKAYYCFCSEDELEAQRQYQMSIGETPRYSGKCSDLPKETVKKYLEEKKPSIIRFRVHQKKIVFKDLIRGELEFDSGLMGDIVIAKDLLTPLYNFSVVVDDFEMKISHVIRGEDHISNTPKQILMQEALGFNRPEYAHLPLILGPDRSKLSKRHGAVSVVSYKKEGYLAEAIVNFISFLGWNPGDEREIYSLPSLVKEFSLEKVQKGGAVFNIKKLDYLNGFYIRKKSPERLAEMCLPYLEESGLVKKENVDLNYLKSIVSIYHERLKKLSEIVELTDFFFREKLEYEKELLRWKEMTDEELKNSLEKLEKIFSKINSGAWTKVNLENALMPKTEKAGDRGILLWPLRVALSGKKSSAGPFEIAEILGKEKTLERLREAKNLL